MTDVLFYHLTRRRVDQALPELLSRTLQREWRALVLGVDDARLEDLNARLWTYRDDSFLPHGGPGDGHAEAQPIYLTTGAERPNGAQVLFLVDGAFAAPDEMTAYERVCLLFDGADGAAVKAARDAWKTVTEAGLNAAYWAESDSGKWEKKAEKTADPHADV